MFTNGNDWYIDTLINNLITSYNKWNTENTRVIGVICTDDKALEKAQSLGMKCCLLQSKDLRVNTLYNSLDNEASYRRLCFVKTIITYHALILDYNVIYIDPDMSFNLKQKIDFLDILTEGSIAVSYKFDNPDDQYSSVSGQHESSSEYEAIFCGVLRENMGHLFVIYILIPI